MDVYSTACLLEAHTTSQVQSPDSKFYHYAIYSDVVAVGKAFLHFLFWWTQTPEYCFPWISYGSYVAIVIKIAIVIKH